MNNSYKISRTNRLIISTIIIVEVFAFLMTILTPPPHGNNIVVSSEESTTVVANQTSRGFDDDYEPPAKDQFRNIIGEIITVIQILGTGIVLVAVIISFFKMIKAKANYKANPSETSNIKRIVAAKTFKAYIITLGIFFIITEIRGMVTSFAKPIIYFYPENNNTKIEISLSHPEDITCSYPKYNNGWHVLADTDGTLKLEDSSREYYSLYWEGNNHRDRKIENGFVVKGSDTAKFLEEKLSILGLTDKEAEEFIVYWLPKMEKNNYNLIRFIPLEELNEENELIIEPKPDTLIRVMMEYKPLLFKINVEEQQLEKASREGFTVVEWGGTEL